jgi:hypothetical protein
MSGRPRSPVGRALPWVAVVLGLALVVAVGGQREDEGNPLDPASPGPLGTKGLVEVLRELGGRVAVSAAGPGATTEVALLLSDDLTPGRRQGLLDWVARGGTLVVADPSSGVTEVEQVGSTRIGLLDAELQRRCPVPALAGVGRVAAPGGVVFGIPEGAGGRACFPRNDGAWLLIQPVGAGTVVRLGGASVLVNEHLGEADNGVLLASLLVPAEGTAVQVLQPPLPGGGAGRWPRPSRSSCPERSWWWPSATCCNGPRAAARRPGCSPTTCAARWPNASACPPRPRPTRWPTPSPPAPASPASGSCAPSPTPHLATRPSSSPSAKPSTASAGRSSVFPWNQPCPPSPSGRPERPSRVCR